MDIEVEAVALLVNDSAVRAFFESGVSSRHFSDSKCAEIYEFACDYFRNYGSMINAPTESVLEDAFPETYRLLVEGATKGVSASYIIEKLQNKYVAKGVEDSLRAFLPNLKDKPKEVSSLIISSITQSLQNACAKTQTVEYGADIAFQEYLAKINESSSFVPYPVSLLNDRTGGMKEGELTVFAAKASGGKTWFACASALAAMKAGWNVYFATLEMPIADMLQRIEFLDSGKVSPLLYSQKVRTQDDIAEMKATRERIASYEGRLIVDQPPAGERTASSLVARCKNYGCNFIIIDQLQFITKDAKFEKSYQALEKIMYEIKTLISAPSDGIKLPMLLMHQFNREGVKSQGNGNLIGSMSNLAGSSVIEQVADTVWGLGQSMDGTSSRKTLAVLKGRRFPEFGYQMIWETDNRARIDVDTDYEGMPVELEKW